MVASDRRTGLYSRRSIRGYIWLRDTNFYWMRCALPDIDAIALVPGANLSYMLGLTIHSSERLAVALLGVDGSVRIVLPALEQPRAASETRLPAQFYPWSDTEGYVNALASAAREAGLERQVGCRIYGDARARASST